MDTAPFGPWHPGVVSPVPAALRPRTTALVPEHVLTPYAEAVELADLTGLPITEVVAFRPARLALHEVLVRVTADFSVPDGPRIEDLGINMREIARALLVRHVEPLMPALEAQYEDMRSRIAGVVARELAALDTPPQSHCATPRRGIGAWFRRDARARAEAPAEDDSARETRWVEQWQSTARTTSDEVEQATLRALGRAAGAMIVRHGRVWGDRALLARLVTGMACNDAASAALGRSIEPLLRTAAKLEGYALLPAQDEPVVMNTKGPSAAGKSTIRPLQRELAGRTGVSWADFALISPDIWRKQLLDYASLGADYKYAASLTGDEVGIIDGKLDRYMARKAERGDMPHLLIDRFRFDSFAPDSDEAGSNLLTRFGARIYLFFLVTPPASLVERAWNRGLDVGRYKSVDDVLAHAVEAYSGFSELFFTWVARADKRVHFEFLDNDVPRGERPRTAAFGWNDRLYVLDVGRLLDIERFRKLDIDATRADAIFPDRAALDAARNLQFLADCMARFATVTFADQASGRAYLVLERGRMVWRDGAWLAQAAASSSDLRAVLAELVPEALGERGHAEVAPRVVTGDERVHTVGRWAEAVSEATSASDAPSAA